MQRTASRDPNDGLTVIVAVVVVIALVMVLFWRLTLPPVAVRNARDRIHLSRSPSPARDIPLNLDTPPPAAAVLDETQS